MEAQCSPGCVKLCCRAIRELVALSPDKPPPFCLMSPNSLASPLSGVFQVEEKECEEQPNENIGNDGFPAVEVCQHEGKDLSLLWIHPLLAIHLRGLWSEMPTLFAKALPPLSEAVPVLGMLNEVAQKAAWTAPMSGVRTFLGELTSTHTKRWPRLDVPGVTVWGLHKAAREVRRGVTVLTEGYGRPLSKQLRGIARYRLIPATLTTCLAMWCEKGPEVPIGAVFDSFPAELYALSTMLVALVSCFFTVIHHEGLDRPTFQPRSWLSHVLREGTPPPLPPPQVDKQDVQKAQAALQALLPCLSPPSSAFSDIRRFFCAPSPNGYDEWFATVLLRLPQLSIAPSNQEPASPG